MTGRTSGASGRGRAPGWASLTLLLLSLLLLACGSAREPDRGLVEGPRVVSLIPSLGELVVAMGGGDNLVARTDYDTHPDIRDLPSVGGGLDPSLERLAELGVEMVLTMEGQETPALSSRLEDMGIQVLTFSTNTISDLYLAMLRLGELLGKEAQADSLSDAIRGGLASIQARTQGRRAVPVMYVVGLDPPLTTGPGTFIDELIRVAGGRNVFQDLDTGWPVVSFEAMVRRSPEVLIWPTSAFEGGNPSALEKMAGWREVPAVQRGSVLMVDPNLFNRPGPGLPEAARILAEALHPEAFLAPAGSAP